MKLFIKGKGFTDWTEVEFEETDDNDFKVIMSAYYINDGYDVKLEQ